MMEVIGSIEMQPLWLCFHPYACSMIASNYINFMFEACFYTSMVMIMLSLLGNRNGSRGDRSENTAARLTVGSQGQEWKQWTGMTTHGTGMGTQGTRRGTLGAGMGTPGIGKGIEWIGMRIQETGMGTQGRGMGTWGTGMGTWGTGMGTQGNGT